MRAALIYQHATSGRDRAIAASMDRRIAQHVKERPSAEVRSDRHNPDEGPGPELLERATGIEPAPSVWKTETLPLSYARMAATECGRRPA